jgi:hypothetical protein
MLRKILYIAQNCWLGLFVNINHQKQMLSKDPVRDSTEKKTHSLALSKCVFFALLEDIQ